MIDVFFPPEDQNTIYNIQTYQHLVAFHNRKKMNILKEQKESNGCDCFEGSILSAQKNDNSWIEKAVEQISSQLCCWLEAVTPGQLSV